MLLLHGSVRPSSVFPQIHEVCLALSPTTSCHDLLSEHRFSSLLFSADTRLLSSGSWPPAQVRAVWCTTSLLSHNSLCLSPSLSLSPTFRLNMIDASLFWCCAELCAYQGVCTYVSSDIRAWFPPLLFRHRSCLVSGIWFATRISLSSITHSRHAPQPLARGCSCQMRVFSFDYHSLSAFSYPSISHASVAVSSSHVALSSLCACSLYLLSALCTSASFLLLFLSICYACHSLCLSSLLSPPTLSSMIPCFLQPFLQPLTRIVHE